MAIPILTALDLSKNELRQGVFHLLATDPASPVEGQFWYNTTDHRPKLRLNGSTLDLSDALTLGGQLGSYYLARANHTGTQAAATISDLATVVKAYRLDEFTAPTAPVSLGSQRLTSVADPTSAQDAATKAYVDAMATGLDVKSSVRVATTANITLSGTQTIDGVAVIAGDRVLVKNQSTASENGLWVVAAGTWTRATDADADAEVTAGLFTFVEEGTVGGGVGFVLTTANPIVVGTTSLTFTQFSGATDITAGAGLTKTGTTIDVETASAGRIVVNADNIDLASGVVTPGTYDSVTVDTYGRVTAGANPARTGKYSALIGDGSATSIAITQATHGLASNGQMAVALYDASSGAQVLTDVSINNANGTVTLTFAVAPTSNQYRVVIIG